MDACGRPCAFSKSPEYESFRSSCALRKVAVDEENPDKVWQLYDCGPKTQTCPVMCLPPMSGTADCFYQQCMGLSARGHRVIAAEYPAYWTLEEWCLGFRELLSHLSLEKVHIFGSGLGGFLAQKFAEFTRPCPRVASLVLCNTFTDTSIFDSAEQAHLFWMMPAQVLRCLLLPGVQTESSDSDIARANEFMAGTLESLSQSCLASRSTLNCMPAYVQPQNINDLPITVMDVWDKSALTDQAKEDVHKAYPNAKRAHLKTGGNFPFLSRSDEVNLHLLIHLRNFEQALS